MQVPIERITRDQRDRYLTVGGFPGNELNGVIMDDTDEYDGLVAQMIKTLERYGSVGIDAECAYYMNRYAPADYFPCVEVKGVEFVNLEIVAKLHSDLLTMPKKYRIDVCSAMPFWNDDLNIFIEHERLYWYAEDDTAHRIGLLDRNSLPMSGTSPDNKPGG